MDASNTSIRLEKQNPEGATGNGDAVWMRVPVTEATCGQLRALLRAFESEVSDEKQYNYIVGVEMVVSASTGEEAAAVYEHVITAFFEVFHKAAPGDNSIRIGRLDTTEDYKLLRPKVLCELLTDHCDQMHEPCEHCWQAKLEGV